MWNIASDVVVTLHFLWIVFLVFGAIIGAKLVWVKWLHVSGLTFSVVLQIFHWTCPLTALEQWLTLQQNETLSYPGEFLPHILKQLVYVDVSPYYIFVVTILIIVLSLWTYRVKLS